MRILEILTGPSYDSVITYKDAGMLLYELNVEYNHRVKYCGCNRSDYITTWNKDFLDCVEVEKVSESLLLKHQIKDIKKYIQKNIFKYDVVIFFNYGSTVYKLAKYCKKINPNIIVYSKLDMGKGGFYHFSPNRMFFKARNCLEKYKSKHVDFFTVETDEYYQVLKNTPMFKKRLYYLPNGVSTIAIDNIDVELKNKENIVITVGRLGIYEKNTELFLNSIMNISEDMRNQWKYYFVGPQTEEFSLYMNKFLNNNPTIADNIVQLGNIADRNKLAKLLKKAKIICMPSRSESTCIATLEGMFFGCIPVVSRYSAFVKDTTNNEMIGKVVDDYTSRGLATVLEAYMRDEEKIRTEMEQSMMYARTKFNYKQIASELNEIISNYVELKNNK